VKFAGKPTSAEISKQEFRYCWKALTCDRSNVAGGLQHRKILNRGSKCFEHLATLFGITGNHQDDLPTSIEALREFVLNARRQLKAAQREAMVAQQQAVELAATVSSQKQQLDRSECRIRELLAVR